MTESIFGALAPGHGTDMHRQQNTDNSTETRAQTSLCHTICVCYISVTSTVFHPSSPCSKPSPHSQAGLRKRDVKCTTLSTEEWWAHTDTSRFLKTLNAAQPKPFPLVLREDKQSLEISSHAPLGFHKTLNLLPLSLQSLSLLFPSFHVALKTSRFSLDWWDYVGVLPFRGVQVRQAPTGRRQL